MDGVGTSPSEEGSVPRQEYPEQVVINLPTGPELPKQLSSKLILTWSVRLSTASPATWWVPTTVGPSSSTGDRRGRTSRPVSVSLGGTWERGAPTPSYTRKSGFRGDS